MKRFKLIIVVIISLFLIGCKNENNKDTIEIVVDKTTIAAGDDLYIGIKASKLGNFVYESSDESIAIVDEYGFLSALSKGNVTITVYLESEPSLKTSIDLTITDMVVNNIKVSGLTMGHVGDVLELTYILYPRGVEESMTFSSSNTEVATIDPTGKVKLLSLGFSTIKITTETNFTKEFKVGAFDFSKIVVDPNNTNTVEGEKITIDGVDYYNNYTYLTSIKDAIKYVDEDGIINVLEGDITQDFAINKNGIKLYGINKNNDPNKQEFSKNTNILNTITIASDLSDIEIMGFTFTSDGCINLYGNNDNLIIANNLFYNTSISSTWSSISADSLIFFRSNNSPSDNVLITQNKFENATTTCITLSYMLNLKITNNTFEGFTLDAVKSNITETLDSCQFLIKGNTFKNGGYSAIYLPAFGSKVVPYSLIISIFDNVFENIGLNQSSFIQSTYGAVSLLGFNGGTTEVVVRYNDFINCKSNVRVDNNQSDLFFNNLNVDVNYNVFKLSSNTTNLFVSYKEISKTKTVENENFIDCKNNVYLNLDDTEVTNISSYSNYSDVNTKISYNEYKKLERLYSSPTLHLEEDAKIISESDDATFTSSNKNVLTVDEEGHITPVAKGEAIIIASVNGVEVARMDFRVKDSINIDYASLLVSIALKEEGYREGANNYTKYGVWYSGEVSDSSFAYGAWCAMFVSWCANQANIPRTIIPLYASCSAGRQWFETRGLFKYKESYTPKTGDIIFFLSNGASHTGIVVDYRNGTVYTIEGNTSDMCHQRSYDPMNARITGYGTPEYPIYNGSKIEFDVSSATSGEGLSTR